MKRRPNRGFTLIELLASAVLTAMMMAALMSVVWTSVRESKQLQKDEVTRWPVTQLADLMRRDFVNARGMAIQPGGVTLHGFLEEAGDTPTYRIGRVQYGAGGRPGDNPKRNLLVRTHTQNGNVSREAVWVGFGALQVEPLEEGDSENALLVQPTAGGLPACPGSFRVTLFSDTGQVLWREVIHHHAG